MLGTVFCLPYFDLSMGECCHSIWVNWEVSKSESGQMPNYSAPIVRKFWNNQEILCCKVEHKNDDGKTKQCDPPPKKGHQNHIGAIIWLNYA